MVPAQDVVAPEADLAEVARYLPVLEQIASLPTSSVATRNFVRRLRSIAPPELIHRDF